MLAWFCFASSAWAGPGDLLVSVNPSSADKAFQAAGVEKERNLAPGQMLVDPRGSSAEALQDLKDQPGVFIVEPDRQLRILAAPNDQLWGNLWGMQRIQADQLWPASPVTVAVIDSGVDYTHPDLSSQMWQNPGEVSNGKDDDNNGFVDDIYGADWVERDGTPMDLNSHGTHVAGTVAASAGNSIGVAGAAPQARVMALRFLGADGSGSTSDAVSAVDYATAKGAKVINNSWGGGGYSAFLSSAFDRARAAGVLVVNAAGNSSLNIDSSPSYPAAYSHDNMLSVAATDSGENLASFSNYGATQVDLGAPGVSIQSTIPGSRYAFYSGTSMASPHVAGAAALLWGRYPTASVAQLKSALMSGGSPQASLAGKTVSGKRLSVPGAAALLSSGPTPDPDPVGPKPSYTSAPAIQRLSALTLRCSPGVWKDATSYAYSWTRNGTVIDGASVQDYPLTEPDNLRSIRCVVTATGPGGSASASSSPVITRVPLKPRPLISPMVVGQAKAGSRLYCAGGAWSGDFPMTFSVRWLADGQLITGATSSMYTVKSSDAGRSLSCRVIASNRAGSTQVDSSSVTARKFAR